MPELSKTYSPQDVEDKIYRYWESHNLFHARVNAEKKITNPEFNMVRVGIESTKTYRIIIDVKDCARPIIFFAGDKDASVRVIEPKNRKFVNYHDRAVREGQPDAFRVLEEFVQQPQNCPNGNANGNGKKNGS